MTDFFECVNRKPELLLIAGALMVYLDKHPDGDVREIAEAFLRPYDLTERQHHAVLEECRRRRIEREVAFPLCHGRAKAGASTDSDVAKASTVSARPKPRSFLRRFCALFRRGVYQA